PLKFTGIFEGCLYKGVPSKTLRQRKTQCFQGFFAPCSSYEFAAEQKARTTYDNLLRLIRDPDVRDPIKFLRQREIVHFQRFGESLEQVRRHLDSKNYYRMNPAFDK
ncbi:MAG: manganese catalase family protein, partial [Clostridia bacterium]|nr:manganese catalase family protein [Clostridia bacterium]